jgi:C4-dicarboxylate-specific signal transduction histidine kinase
MLDARSGRILAHRFAGGAGRWEVRHRRFREGGRPHELLVISDLSRALREEERQAWQRIVRVIGHELNSSLTPIRSMAGTLRKLVHRDPLPGDWREDADAALTIIHDRAEALGRFMGAYARLARLPPPTRREVEFSALVQRVVSLHAGSVTVLPGPSLVLSIDADQIEQVLINLVKNAAEALTGRDDGRVVLRGARDDQGKVLLQVIDNGPGIDAAHVDDIFLPFFTTKRSGSGVGLSVSRQIMALNKGVLSVKPALGGGSEFTLRFR